VYLGAALLNRLCGDDDAYAAYHAWRREDFRADFQRLLERNAVPAFDRLARAVRDHLARASTAPGGAPCYPFAGLLPYQAR
jgi:hypothetical protein